MSLRIYQIPFALRACFDEAFVDDDGVFHFDEATFNEVAANAEAKIANCGRYIREQENTIEAMKAAAKDILDRAKAEEKKLERLKSMTLEALQALGRPVNDPDIRVSTRKSKKVIVDEFLLHADWFTEKVTRKPNLTALRDALSQGVEIEGAQLSENFNLQIK